MSELAAAHRSTRMAADAGLPSPHEADPSAPGPLPRDHGEEREC